MMDDIPPPIFIIAGIGIAVFSAFIGLRTDFMRFIFFFVAAAALIAFGIIKTMFAGDKKRKPYTPPADPYAGKPVQIDRRLLDEPLSAPGYPRPESFARGQGFEQYQPQQPTHPYAPQPQYQQPQQYVPQPYQPQPVRRYRGFYQNQPTAPNKSRFHDRVRQTK